MQYQFSTTVDWSMFIFSSGYTAADVMCPDPITSCIAQSPIRQDADYTHDLLTMLSCRLAFNNLNGKIKYLTLTERSKVSG